MKNDEDESLYYNYCGFTTFSVKFDSNRERRPNKSGEARTFILYTKGHYYTI